jgi:acetylserotonin N-methyltransferase
MPLSYQAVLAALQQDKSSAFESGKVLSREWEKVDLPDERAAVITQAMHSHSFASPATRS